MLLAQMCKKLQCRLSLFEWRSHIEQLQLQSLRSQQFHLDHNLRHRRCWLFHYLRQQNHLRLTQLFQLVKGIVLLVLRHRRE
jgi:hypothetical protein